MDVREKLRQSFNAAFEYWEIELPVDALEPGVVWLILHRGWTIWTRYDVENGQEYLDYYATHRMTNDRHLRMYVDGDAVGLPTMDLVVGRHVTEAEWEARRVFEAKMLEEKGFIMTDEARDRAVANVRQRGVMVSRRTPRGPGETGTLARAQGCLLGQIAGDALGSLVEFWPPEEIRAKYPDSLRELADGGTWDTIAGQPTDDSEMALSLARMIVGQGRYDPEGARKVYVAWLDSDPFDCGNTVYSGLRKRPDLESQANGALMRISPLGIFGAHREPAEVAEWARQDAALTHPHPVCIEANALFTRAIAHAIRTGCDRWGLYDKIVRWAKDSDIDETLHDAVVGASVAPPDHYGPPTAGWVLVALRNALWQLLTAANLEEALVDTVMRGGDTDTNACICGALFGAVEGAQAVPTQWTECLRNCRPAKGTPGVYRPRPKRFWPVDAPELAERLLRAGAKPVG